MKANSASIELKVIKNSKSDENERKSLVQAFKLASLVKPLEEDHKDEG